MKLTKFEDSLHERLRDPAYAQSYLQAALREGDKHEWLIAVREVAAATEGGVTNVAKKAKVGRESLYKSLSSNGNPQFETVRSVLDALGFELVVQRIDLANRARSADVSAPRSRQAGTLAVRARKHAKPHSGKGLLGKANALRGQSQSHSNE